MEKFILTYFSVMITFFAFSQGNVGIGTLTPYSTALLHVDLGASTTNGVLVTGAFNGFSTFPTLGTGTRLMFYPGKAAFRVGHVDGTRWDGSFTGRYSFASGHNTQADGENSIASGFNTTAHGTSSTAFGASTKADGIYSIAGGYNTYAKDMASVAIGYQTSATEDYAVALGANTTASGRYSTSMGQGTTASGWYSTAMGGGTIASGPNSVAMGDKTIATMNNATAMGSYTQATGYSSTAMGDNTVANGHFSTALGTSTITRGYSSTVIGTYNNPILFSQESTFSSTTPLFIVGNGDSSTARSNALVVRKDGRVGIGTNTPGFLLDVSGRIRIESEGGSITPGVWLNKTDNSGLAAFIGIYNDNYVGFYGNLGGWDFLMNTNTGYIGLGTNSPSQRLSVVGNICYTGTIGACSDIRYKKDILPITQALSHLLKLHGIYYNWDKEKFADKGFTDERQIGFSAQEVEKIFPEMVQNDADGYKSVDYSRMTPVLVEAMKEQQKQIEELKNENDTLKTHLIKLEKLMKKNNIE